MPAGVVDNEQSAFGFQRRDLCCQMIEVILEDVGIDSVKDHCRAFSGRGTHRAEDVRPDVVSEIRHGGPAAPSAPAPPWTGIALHPAFVGKPDLYARIGLPAPQLL